MTKKNDRWISHPEFLSSGYESSMHFIAGVLLAVMEAEDAFWCLCSIIALRPKSKPPIREWANISDWTGPAITDKQVVYDRLCMFMLSQEFGIYLFLVLWSCFTSMVAVNFCSNRESKEKMLPAGFYSCGDHDYSFGVELDCLTRPQWLRSTPLGWLIIHDYTTLHISGIKLLVIGKSWGIHIESTIRMEW